MSTSLLPVQQHFNESQSVTHIYDFFVLKKELFVNESI